MKHQRSGTFINVKYTLFFSNHTLIYTQYTLGPFCIINSRFLCQTCMDYCQGKKPLFLRFERDIYGSSDGLEVSHKKAASLFKVWLASQFMRELFYECQLDSTLCCEQDSFHPYLSIVGKIRNSTINICKIWTLNIPIYQNGII